MRRLAIAALLASLVAAPAGLALQASGIESDSIVGVKLGITHAKARTLLGSLVRPDRLEDGYDRLVSGRQKVEVYFRKGTRGAVVVTTWSKTLRTDKRIGPCSTVAALRAAYGSGLQPFRQGGKLLAYRLGNLVFATEGGRRVSVVALGRGTAAVYVALNAPECH